MRERPRLLVIEDEPSIGQILADLFADEAYDVRLAATGREGLDLLRDWLPDVIVLDLMMPGMDGRTFRSEQRSLPGRAAEVPIVVLSAAREARALAADLDAAAVVAKPFLLDEVLEAVAQVAERPLV